MCIVSPACQLENNERKASCARSTAISGKKREVVVSEVEPIWHIQDSQGLIREDTALAYKSVKALSGRKRELVSAVEPIWHI